MRGKTLALVPFAAQAVVPWRNGGGTTREVAVGRDGARGDFRWRVSVARVTQDGPFSSYPGIDRTLWLLRGAGMRLVVDGREVLIDSPHRPFALRGEAVVDSYLLSGPTEDLNVMIERATTQAEARVVSLSPHEQIELALAPHAEALVLALDASVEVAVAQGPAQQLCGGDALLCSSDRDESVRIRAGEIRSALLWARFERLSRA